MLQVLDDGVLTDGLGRKVDFKNTIIIMTSNIGTHPTERHRSVGYITHESHPSTTHSDYRKALEQTFAPEFINRIDDIVVFDTLRSEDIEAIAELEFGRLCQRAASLGYRIEISAQALRHLAVHGYQPHYGVRSLKRQITEHIEEPLAQMIIAGEITVGDTIGIECLADELRLLVKAA